MNGALPPIRACIGVAVVSLCTLGCIDVDDAVFVRGTIDNAGLAVQSSALSTGISGSLRLNFHLAERASGESEVTLRSVSVTNAARSDTLANLKVASDIPFPITVPVAGDVAAQLSYAAGDNLLDTNAVGPLCDSAGIVIIANFDDALLGATSVAASEPFQASGCP